MSFTIRALSSEIHEKYIERVKYLEGKVKKLEKENQVLMEAVKYYVEESDKFPDSGFLTKGGIAREALSAVKRINRKE